MVIAVITLRTKMLTEELTKLLTPGANMREMSACVYSMERLLQTESLNVLSQILYEPIWMKQSISPKASPRIPS
jgi:hypothetical protein